MKLAWATDIHLSFCDSGRAQRFMSELAEAGADATADEGSLIPLHGAFTSSAGNDPTFRWQVIRGANEVVFEATTAQSLFVPADNGLYTATFTVTDDNGTASDQRVLTVNNVAPGTTVTPMVERGIGGAQAQADEAVRSGVLIKPERLADPSEIAAAVVFLCGPGSEHTTGTTMHVNGGTYCP